MSQVALKAGKSSTYHQILDHFITLSLYHFIANSGVRLA
jgi:hypothetical protein